MTKLLNYTNKKLHFNKIILAMLFLWHCFSFGQIEKDYNQTSLISILKDIENTSSYTFSYAEDLVKNKKASLRKDTQYNINEVLISLEAQTGLRFKKISDDQIIIGELPINKNKVHGYVIDGNNFNPIPFATITIGQNKYLSTNSNGFFVFEGETNQTYSVENAYHQKQNFVYKNQCLSIYLQESVENLSEVVITGYITSGIDRNKDGSLNVTTKSLGILPGLVSPDIAQSIQLIPGISTLDESATGIQIRGGSPDQNLILYDDIKLYNTGYFYGMFSLFNPFATESATVFRSGTSAAYGDRISGIIDISSGDKIPYKTEGGVEVDGLAVNGYVKTPLSDKVGLYVFARRSYADVLETPTYDSYADKIFTNFGVARDINGNVLDLETDDDFSPETSNHEFYFSDVNAKIIINPDEKNSIAISGLYTLNELDFSFGDLTESLQDDLTTQNAGFSVNWKHQTNDKQQEEVTAYYSYYDSFYQNDELKDEKDDITDGVIEVTEINIRENKISDVGLNLTSTRQIEDHQKLTVGYQISNTDLKVVISKTKPFEPSDNSNEPQNNSNLKNALFGEYTYKFKNKGLINGGLRFVHYSSVGEFKIEPRINFEYPITPNLRFKTALERRNQPISQLIEFNHTELRLENDLWRLSDNKEYPLLSSDQISGGLLFQYKGFNLDLDAYYKELKGLTTFTSGFSNPLENLQEGTSTIKGVDVLLKYKWRNYKIWTGYTFNDITFNFPGLDNNMGSFPGNNDIKHQFRISHALKYGNCQFSLGWQFRSGKPFTPVNNYKIELDSENEKAGVVDFGAVNSDRLPNFHRLDASVLYDFHINTGGRKLKSQFGISALNIYNRVKLLNIIYKAEVKPLDDGGIAKNDGSGENELILEQVIQRFSLGFTPNAVLRIFF